ncbi:hypothetical protein [Streptomyces sp. CB01881]|uniref:hypothetical protein n=1 Tax=Streptomyces sp. CB01881 TaxID=2078691 RepID=UPI0011E02EE9|nr:hypothetical protein [Streptomyces sp. CB01881]TYC76796.1 hypothetical protein EH183_04290 [Streptomyces sp. CB01881]
MGTNTVSPEDLAALVDRLRWDKRRHPHRGRGEYQATAHQVLETAATLVEAGRAHTVVRTLRTAMDRVTRALMYLDDSSGIVGDALQGLVDLYARALEQAPPANPKTLASWLVSAQFDGPGWPRIHLRAFAPAFGEQDIAEITAQVQARAATTDPDSWRTRFAVRDFREQLAELTGDTDHYIAVLAEDLKEPEQYRRIAHALVETGRAAEAVDWARRGLVHHPGNPYSDRLRDLLVDLLLDDGQLDAALDVRITESAPSTSTSTKPASSPNSTRPDWLPDPLGSADSLPAAQRLPAPLKHRHALGPEQQSAWPVAWPAPPSRSAAARQGRRGRRRWQSRSCAIHDRRYASPSSAPRRGSPSTRLRTPPHPAARPTADATPAPEARPPQFPAVTMPCRSHT